MTIHNTLCPVCGKDVPVGQPPVGLRPQFVSRPQQVPVWVCGRACAEQAQRDPDRIIEAAEHNVVAETPAF
jgi:hypothetical protein